jgi:hypothetical protein
LASSACFMGFFTLSLLNSMLSRFSVCVFISFSGQETFTSGLGKSIKSIRLRRGVFGFVVRSRLPISVRTHQGHWTKAEQTATRFNQFYQTTIFQFLIFVIISTQTFADRHKSDDTHSNVLACIALITKLR